MQCDLARNLAMPKTAYCDSLSKPKSCAKTTTSPISPLLEEQSQLQVSAASTGRRLRCQHHTSAVETALTELFLHRIPTAREPASSSTTYKAALGELQRDHQEQRNAITRSWRCCARKEFGACPSSLRRADHSVQFRFPESRQRATPGRCGFSS